MFLLSQFIRSIIHHKLNFCDRTVQSFLLSCRILGKGVEYEILGNIGKIAQEGKLDNIELIYKSSARNKPALDFLNSLKATQKENQENSLVFSLLSRNASKFSRLYVLEARPSFDQQETIQEGKESLSSDSSLSHSYLASLTTRLCTAKHIQEEIHQELIQVRRQSENYSPARNALENFLIGIFEDFLKVTPIGIFDNFFEYGGNSLLAMQAIGVINKALGVKYSLKELFEYPTVSDLAQKLKDAERTTIQAEFLKETSNYPILIGDEDNRFKEFPLTDVQQAYWLGRDSAFELGKVAVHSYMEYEYPSLDIGRLEKAWNELIQRHEALRLIFPGDGQQKILKEVPYYKIRVNDLKNETKEKEEESLKETRERLSHQIFSADQWPLFEVHVSVLKDKVRLHLSYDALILDAWSAYNIFKQWGTIYKTSECSGLTFNFSFRDFVMAERELHKLPAYTQAESYWLSRLHLLPDAPALPLLNKPGSIVSQKFARVQQKFSKNVWGEIQKEALKGNLLSPAGLLLAAFSEVLSCWGSGLHFTINLTLFNRSPIHPQINEIAGDFTSLLLLEADYRDQLASKRFLDRAKKLQEQLWSDLAHSSFSGVEVLRELNRVESNNKSTARMPVVFTCMLGMNSNGRADKDELGDFFLDTTYNITQTPQVWLDYQAYEIDGELLIVWDYVAELFPAGLVEEMHEAYCNLLKDFANNSEIWQAEKLEFLPSTQKEKREQYNQTYWKRRECLLHDLFHEKANAYSDAVAIISARGNLTYKELQTYSNQLGHWLQEEGAAPNKLIAVVMEKGWEQIVGCFGILNAGAAYLPIDPQYPAERLNALLTQGEVEIVLTQGVYQEKIEQLPYMRNKKLLAIDKEETSFKLKNYSIQRPRVTQKVNDLAYVIFTSGSTGQPKGVMIDHQGVTNTILDINDRYKVSSSDKVLALSNLNFDLSVYDIFGVLAAGGTVVIPAENEAKDPKVWLDLLEKHSITLWNTVPMFMQMLIEFLKGEDKKKVKAALRTVLLSGDWIPLELSGNIREVFGKGCQIISLGGATEASIWSIEYPIDVVNSEWRSIPYGRPLRNQSFYVLNDRLDDCPDWVTGHLYIGGVGLAKGYWKDQEKTDKSFITHPDTGEKLYKTGDLGRYLPEGVIEFLGRDDYQVKVGGHRIELGEIEYQLHNHPDVQQAVVDVYQHQNLNHLVAYIVKKHEDTKENKENLPSVSSVDKLEFKLSHHGRRVFPDNISAINLEDDQDDDVCIGRKSYRQYLGDSLKFDALESWILSPLSKVVNNKRFPSREISKTTISKILSVLKAYQIPEYVVPKYRYPSAGGTYPVQAYISFKNEGLLEQNLSYFYYDPITHQLRSIVSSKNSELSQVEEISICLVGCLPAIEPLYGNMARDFCILEAGYINGILKKGCEEEGLTLSIAESLEEREERGLERILGLSQRDFIIGRLNISVSNKEIKEKQEPYLEYNSYLYIDNKKFGTNNSWYCIDRIQRALIPLDYEDKFAAICSQSETEVIFKNSSFSIFFSKVSSPQGAQQKYNGELLGKDILLDIGEYCSALMESGVGQKIGSCPIGKLELEMFNPLREVMGSQICLHALFGGPLTQEQINSRAPSLAPLSQNTNQQEEDDAFQSYLAQRLPEYMVPSGYVFLESFPLTSNGKIDRNALPEPGKLRVESEEYVEARNPVEEDLTKIWGEILRVERIGIRDNFFRIGGHSLLATQVISRIRRHFEVELPLRVMFDYPTIEKLAEQIELHRKEKQRVIPAIKTVSRTGDLPLSFAQQRLWFLDQLIPGTGLYNIPIGFYLEGDLNYQALEKAFERLVERHEALRTTIEGREGQGYQIIHPRLSIGWVIEDLAQVPESDKDKKLKGRISQELGRPFDLSKGPLIRGCLLRTAPMEHVMLITLHHIIGDGWSVGVLLEELSELYNAECEGRGSKLKELPVQYGDFVLWQRDWLQGEVLEGQLSYWKEHLEGSPELLQLPTDHMRPKALTYKGSTYHSELSKDLVNKLKKLGEEVGATIFMTLLAGFEILLQKYSGQEDMVIGTPIANRHYKEIEGLIGFFVNTLALRLDGSGDPSFKELLERTKKVTLGAYEHQDVPFEQLVDHLQVERDLSRHPVFQVVFVLQNANQGGSFKLQDLKTDYVLTEEHTTQLDLRLWTHETEKGILLGFDYAADLFERETVERLAKHYENVLWEVVGDWEKKISEINLLDEEEKQEILVEWNRTDKAYPSDKTIHELFEAQVEKTPESVALAYEGETLTYRELNERSNQLGHYLRKLGVGPETLVGLSLERSLDLVVGILGILKAGGAYVPLDPSYPEERLSFMLEDTQAPVLVTQGGAVNKFLAYRGSLVILDYESSTIAKEPTSNLGKLSNFSNLAYVIYTSGSTGKPKGVMIEHKGVCNLALAEATYLGISANSRVLQFASMSFDAAVWEWAGTLTHGASLYLFSKKYFPVGTVLADILKTNEITITTLPPSALATLPFEETYSLETIVIAGETPNDQVVRSWQERVHLVNAYGPTETTVCASIFHYRDRDSTRTIGKPISNMRIYILDKYLQPVPVGVQGELFIGGVGLARGYLNQPLLTKEKFTPNPFIQQGKSERLYRTGDFARYLPGGIVEYVGRRDNQIKMRGYRIELEEIELLITTHPIVQQGVVIIKHPNTEQATLWAYIQLKEKNYPVANIKSYLSEKLPEHLIPKKLIILEKEFPLTINGKTDRKKLHDIEENKNDEDHSVMPTSEIEKKVASILCNILNLEKIGLYDNFFDLGGNSLLVTSVMMQVQKCFGTNISLRTFLESPTVDCLAKIIDNDSDNSLKISEKESVKDIKLSLDFINSAGIRSSSSSSGSILLTGANGFLGVHMLKDLIEQTSATIYCLIRGRTYEEAEQKLFSAANKNLIELSLYKDRIVILVGDLTRNNLGIEDDLFNKLKREVSRIYHVGALVHHIYDYSTLRATNVDSTLELLKFASSETPKRFYYISALSAGRNNQNEILEEVVAVESFNKSFSGYEESKWVSEQFLKQASQRGIETFIFRPCILSGNSKTAVWPFERDHFMSLLKGCIQLNASPLWDFKLQVLPVDFVSNAITKVSLLSEIDKNIFNHWRVEFPAACGVNWMSE